MSDIVFDLILLEADRVISHKMKDLDLYYKDFHGELIPLADSYTAEVDDVISNLLKRKRMRYMITFTESLEVMDELKPAANKMLRFFTRQMNYGNTIKNYSLRDIQQLTDMNMRYVMKSIAELCEHDVIRFTKEKNRRTYMVNPIYFYKGTIKKIFYCSKEYDRMPKRNGDLEEEYESND
jgi:NAD-dependent dihydropyrimidine dehydrogenase PreA subunit